jgi:hypothetical protein
MQVGISPEPTHKDLCSAGRTHRGWSIIHLTAHRPIGIGSGATPIRVSAERLLVSDWLAGVRSGGSQARPVRPCSSGWKTLIGLEHTQPMQA